MELIKRGSVNWILQCEILKHEELIAMFEKTQLQELKENRTDHAEISKKYIDKYVYVIKVIKKLQNLIDVEKFVKDELPHNVRNCYSIEDIVKCVENWGLCKVEKEHIERFLNDIKGK